MADTETATLIPLDQVEPAMIEEVLDRAFGPDRLQRTAYKVREGMDWLPALSFAALDGEDRLVGTIQVWPVGLTDSAGRQHPMLMVGPVAVVPERQKEGFGQALMYTMLAALDEGVKQGGPPLPQVMIGDPEYYGRFFGFGAEHTGGWTLPGPWKPHRLLARCNDPSILPGEGTLGPWRG
jgi:predicted N-acetyltransferase YhbS